MKNEASEKIDVADNWPYELMPDSPVTIAIGEICFNKDGILIVRYNNNLDFTLDKAKQVIRVCEKITKGKKVYTMVVTGEHGFMDTKTREYLSGPEVARHRKAVALVVRNLPHRIVASFIIRLRKKYYPTRVFRNEECALQWLTLKMYHEK